MKQIINAQFICEDKKPPVDKEALRLNIEGTLACASYGITLLLEGDPGYNGPIERLLAVDYEAATNLMLKAGLLWTCREPICEWHNQESRDRCENCGQPKPTKALLKVMAEVHSDDRKFEATFDATAWFVQADEGSILDLANCGWGGDLPADWVAKHFDGKDPGVTKVFAYLKLEPHMDGPDSDPVGFECHVEPEDARGWIKATLPALYSIIWKGEQ